MIIELPFPPRDLSPNRARNVHWSRKAAAIRAYRSDVKCLAGIGMPTGVYLSLRTAKEVVMTVTFCPPNRQRRDRDNMAASFKAGFDGIADALGVDDSRFVPTIRVGEPVKGGKVVVEIGA